MDNKSRVQKEIVDSLTNPVHGLLNLSPRLGKTKIALEIIKKEKPNSILWVTPSTQLRDIDIPSEFLKWKVEEVLEITTIVCYSSLHKIVGEYDKIILDEFQFITEHNMSTILDGSLKYKTILCLSGTSPKHHNKKEILRKLGLKTIYTLDIEEAKDLKIIAPYKIFLIPVKLNDKDKTIVAGSKHFSFLQTELQNYKYLTKRIDRFKEAGLVPPKHYYLSRMRFIYNLKSKEDKAIKLLSELKGRTLVFSGSIDFAEKLSPNTYHSKTDKKNLNLFLDGKIDILSCVNSGGIGFTFEKVDNFVIVQVNSNYMGDITQKISRALLYQKGYTANIYILYVKDTVDETWLIKVLDEFNKEYIYEESDYRGQ